MADRLAGCQGLAEITLSAWERMGLRPVCRRGEPGRGEERRGAGTLPWRFKASGCGGQAGGQAECVCGVSDVMISTSAGVSECYWPWLGRGRGGLHYVV